MDGCQIQRRREKNCRSLFVAAGTVGSLSGLGQKGIVAVVAADAMATGRVEVVVSVLVVQVAAYQTCQWRDLGYV